jgi:hypothetical protein
VGSLKAGTTMQSMGGDQTVLSLSFLTNPLTLDSVTGINLLHLVCTKLTKLAGLSTV